MSESVQHRPAFTTGFGFGFDDGGERVPVVSPADPESESSEQDIDRARQETILRLVTRLLESKHIERHIVLIGFFMHCPNAPSTQKELATRLRLTEGRVSQIIKLIREDLSSLLG